MAQSEAMERRPEQQRQRTQATGGATLVTDQGRTTIADSVVSRIAGIAASEIDGVYRLVPMGAGATFSNLAQRMAGSEARDRGVAVEVGEREAAVDLSMVVVYGASIPQVAQAVRQNIINRVRDLTGLSVTEVNINVTDLYFPGEEREEEGQQEEQARRRVE